MKTNRTRQQIVDILRSAHISPLESRVAIFAWVDSHPVHPTVDVIHRNLLSTHPALSKTTVYNTLKLLSSANLISCLNIENNEVRYDANISTHAHFKCTICGKIIDMELPPQKLLDTPEISSIDACQVNYYGTCASCKKHN